MSQAFISMGSNLGNPVLNLSEALKKINSIKGITVIRVSSIYLTEPVGYEDQPWFHNCAAELETILSPDQLLTALQNIENELGRERIIRWGPRTVDLDILLYDRLLTNSDQLIIPHPRMEGRSFVMIPLAEIAGEALFPDGRSINEVKNKLDSTKKYSCIRERIW